MEPSRKNLEEKFWKLIKTDNFLNYLDLRKKISGLTSKLNKENYYREKCPSLGQMKRENSLSVWKG